MVEETAMKTVLPEYKGKGLINPPYHAIAYFYHKSNYICMGWTYCLKYKVLMKAEENFCPSCSTLFKAFASESDSLYSAVMLLPSTTMLNGMAEWHHCFPSLLQWFCSDNLIFTAAAACWLLLAVFGNMVPPGSFVLQKWLNLPGNFRLPLWQCSSWGKCTPTGLLLPREILLLIERVLLARVPSSSYK